MTDERAMEILDPDHLEYYESIEPIIEACRIGMEAIRKVKELRDENAALRERLEGSVTLPRVECVVTREWINRETIGDIMFEWCVLYKKDGYLTAEPCLSKEAALARLAEL